jgi:hypothetical protein
MAWQMIETLGLSGLGSMIGCIKITRHLGASRRSGIAQTGFPLDLI